MKLLLKRYFVFIFILILISLQIAYADDIDEEELCSSVFEDMGVVKYMGYPLINARSAVVIDFYTGRVLFEKDAYKLRPMASTTKVMTCIVALENGNLDDLVKVSKRAVSIKGSSMKLRAGEILTLRDLLYGLMLKSGNDASIAIAEHIGGSVENFVKMMNEKAIALGLKHTHFKSPHGLDVKGHYTNAYELAILTRYALKNPIFSNIVKTKSVCVAGHSLINTNEMLFNYPGADGVKTGYTGKAGRCLITSASRGNRRFISVVLFCDSRSYRALSSKKVLDYAFDKYYYEEIIGAGKVVGEVDVYKGVYKKVNAMISKGVILPISKKEKEDLKKEIIIPKFLKAPIKAGDKIGEYKVYLDGKVLAKAPIVAERTVKRKAVSEYLIDIVFEWLKLVKASIVR